MTDWQIPDLAVDRLPRLALGRAANEELGGRERLGWAKLLVAMDRNNIAREAVRSRAEKIVDIDLRNEALGQTLTSAEMRRDPDYLEWSRERAVAADAGAPGSLGVARIVGVGPTSRGD